MICNSASTFPMKLIKGGKISLIWLPNVSDKIYKFFEQFTTIGLLPIPLSQTTHAKITRATFSF
jgi:hypothetical protein